MANRNYNELAKNNKKTENKIQHGGREYVVTIVMYVVLLVPIAAVCPAFQIYEVTVLGPNSTREVLYTAFDVVYCGQKRLREITRKIQMRKSPLPVFVYLKFQEEPTIEIALSEHIYFLSYSSRTTPLNQLQFVCKHRKQSTLECPSKCIAVHEPTSY